MSVQDTTNRKNLLLLVQLRWLAVGGQVLTILVVVRGFGITLPLSSMAIVIGALVLLNLVSLVRLRGRGQISAAELFVELMLDVSALTIQLYLSGGATNPFIWLYLLQVALGAVLLSSWLTWLLIAFAGACFVLLIRYYHELVLPPERAGDLFELHLAGSLVCFVLAASLLAFFIHRISGNLRRRDEHLADLRQRAAEEDHIVRMGLLASGAAHELGTPLATLSVILSDWRRLPVFRADPELSGELGEMQGQLDRCKAIVTGILMSSGEARGEKPVRTSVHAFVDDLVSEWCALRSPAALEYANSFSPNEPMVSDPALKQVIFNVFENALEASPGWIEVRAERRDDQLVIVVRDRGPGFDKTVLAEFGKPYRSTKGRPGGGLGLFLVVNVLRKLGGTVTAINPPQGGAMVTLTLPFKELSRGRADVI